jgi:type II secretory pathway pseudopilin PulG
MARKLLYKWQLKFVANYRTDRRSIHMSTCRPKQSRAESAAFTLVEVCVAMMIAVLVMAGMFEGYNLAARRAQFSAFQLAANAMAMQQMESIVAAQWVISGSASTNIFSQVLTNQQSRALCLPTGGTNLVYATNYASVTQLSTNPPYVMIQVSCVWSFMGMGNFTNTVCAMRSPDL